MYFPNVLDNVVLYQNDVKLSLLKEPPEQHWQQMYWIGVININSPLVNLQTFTRQTPVILVSFNDKSRKNNKRKQYPYH